MIIETLLLILAIEGAMGIILKIIQLKREQIKW